MATLTYRGYTGIIDVDPEAGVIHGSVIGTRDVITFESESAKDIVTAFHDSVDEYLDFCHEKGMSPDKPLPKLPAVILKALDVSGAVAYKCIT